MKKEFVIVLLLMFMFLPFISGDTSGGDLTGKQNELIILPQECPDCTFVKLTTITFPNMSKLSIQTNMDQDGTSFSYNFTSTQAVGEYQYCTLGNIGGTNTSACKDFSITRQGFNINTSQSLIYIIGAILVFLLFLISLYFTITIPWKNVRGQDGSILYIDYKKYLKFCMAFVTYLILIFLFAIGKGISYAFLDSTEIYGFFNVAFIISLVGLAPVLILSVTFMLMSYLTDKKIMRAITRGLPVR